MDKERIVVEDVLTSLEMRDSVREVHIEKTDSPWNEKVLVKRKGDHLNVKINVWEDNFCLWGRIYRLLLYIHDTLDPSFRYDPGRAPKEGEASIWELYSQMWGIYVDSRLERARIPNFYDRTLRRNLFADARKELAWDDAFRLFDTLWARQSYTHAEIVQYAYAPDSGPSGGGVTSGTFEAEVRACLREHSVRKHLERLTSSRLREIANEILSFTSYHCQGALIRSSYYGIHLDYKAATFAELIPTNTNTLLLTLRHLRTETAETVEISEQTDAAPVQQMIKDVFTLFYLDAQSA